MPRVNCVLPPLGTLCVLVLLFDVRFNNLSNAQHHYSVSTIIPHLFHPQKRKLSDGEAHVLSPTSPGAKFNKFKQPLSSPTALYADTPAPSTPTLAGYSAGSTFFAKTISAGEQLVPLYCAGYG